jgi:hypothetical protein
VLQQMQCIFQTARSVSTLFPCFMTCHISETFAQAKSDRKLKDI